MTLLAMQAHLQAACEIVHDTHIPLWGLHVCNCVFQVTDYLGVVFVHSVLQIAPKVKIWGKGGWVTGRGCKSGECGAHSVSHLLMSRSSNRYHNQAWELSAKTQIFAAVKLTSRRERGRERGKTNFHGEKKSGEGKGGKKEEAPVLVPHRIPAKHAEHLHTRLSPVLIA